MHDSNNCSTSFGLDPKATAWKKNRKFGDIIGGRMRTKLDSGIFKRLHSLSPPASGVVLPIFIQDNPSGAFYHPLAVEEIKAILDTLPEEHTQHLTHVWLSKIKKEPYLSGHIPRGSFIGGSKVCLIKLHAVSKDNRLYFGRKRPTMNNLSFYKEHSTDLRKNSHGFYLQFTDVTIGQSTGKCYYTKSGIVWTKMEPC